MADTLGFGQLELLSRQWLVHVLYSDLCTCYIGDLCYIGDMDGGPWRCRISWQRKGKFNDEVITQGEISWGVRGRVSKMQSNACAKLRRHQPGIEPSPSRSWIHSVPLRQNDFHDFDGANLCPYSACRACAESWIERMPLLWDSNPRPWKVTPTRWY